MKNLRKRLKIFWKKLTGKTDLQSFHRQQEKFRKSYPNYKIGIGTYGLPIVHDSNQGSTLSIGSYSSISGSSQIFLGGQHRIDWVSSYPFPFFMEEAKDISYFGVTRGDVIIGSDVWICANCIILSGVTIGHGAVIANGAMITRDVPPYAVMAGNPARIIRFRFEEHIRNALLESQWWEWPEEEIRHVLDKICTENITEFIAYAQSRETKSNT